MPIYFIVTVGFAIICGFFLKKNTHFARFDIELVSVLFEKRSSSISKLVSRLIVDFG